MKYEVLKPFFKQSEQKNYAIGDFIELSEEDAENMLKYDLVKNNSYANSEEGTKGIVTRKTPEQADKEIKKLNKK